MRQIELNITSTDITTKKSIYDSPILITSGSVNDIVCKFMFSDEWDEYTEKVAVFIGNGNTISVIIKNNSAIIPHECLSNGKSELIVGITGIKSVPERNTFEQMNTELFSLGIITKGNDISPSSLDNAPTPDLSQQLLIEFSNIKLNENDRVENEETRVHSENNRFNTEIERTNSENMRCENESIRIANENDRKDDEIIRSHAEQERKENEAQRVNNEQARISAETERETTFSSYREEIESIRQQSEGIIGQLSEQHQMMLTLESKIDFIYAQLAQ